MATLVVGYVALRYLMFFLPAVQDDPAGAARTPLGAGFHPLVSTAVAGSAVRDAVTQRGIK